MDFRPLPPPLPPPSPNPNPNPNTPTSSPPNFLTPHNMHVCAVRAATRRSYTRHSELGTETTLEAARAEAVDPNLLSNSYPTLFYRLAATAEHIEGHVSPESTVSVGSEKPSISSLRVAR